MTVTPTSTLLVAPNSSGVLTGLSVSGDTVDQVQVTVATTIGTLTISTTTGLTLGYGNSWSGTASVTFSGLQSAVNVGLASTTLVTNGTTGTAVIGLTAMVAQSGYNYLASNQHFYKYVACSTCSWTSSDVAAQALSFGGQQGYLASIPNAVVNTFISTKIANATNVWFGARAYESIAIDGTQSLATVSGTIYPRVWRWISGASESPIAGGVISECTNYSGSCTFANSGSFYSSWNTGEPNNSGSSGTAYNGEYVAVTNWNGTSGSWNDLPPSNNGASGYVVEYGGKANSDTSLGTGFAGVVTTSSNVLVAAAAVVASAPSVTATAGDSAANLSWTPPSDGGSAITSYQVSTNGGGTWTTISTTTTITTVNGNVVNTVTATAAGLTNGTSYNVEVRAVSAVGNGAASSGVAITPVAVPGPPTGVSGIRGNGFVGVTFTAPAGNGGSAITGYVVTASPGGASCSTMGAPSCNMVGLANGTAYTFTAHATNAVGNSVESSPSSAVTPATVPGPPTTVSAISGNGSAVISFIAAANNGGSAVTGFTVTASVGGATGSCATSPCSVTGLANGTAYTFTVHATNAVGNSVESSASAAVTPATVPDPPTSVLATRENASASVSWSAPASNGGSAITGYRVTASPGGTGATCTTSPCVVSGLANGTAYTFTVHATNALGDSTESSVSAPVTPATVPDSPASVSATRANNSATVSFSAPTNNGGSVITGFVATASPGGTVASCSVSPCSVTGLTNGTVYTFTVHATNLVGNSAESSPSNAVTPATVPDPPTGVSATRGSGSAAVTFTAPLNSGGSSGTGYVVTSLPGGQTCTTSGATSCTVTGLTDGAAYTFTVHATNAVGSSAESTPSAAVTPASVPNAPTAVSASRGNGSAVVAITAPASNGGSVITGYTVTASPGGSTCSATGTTSCTVTSLTNGTLYTFTVHATNAVGNSVESSSSNAVTPATVPDPPSNVSVTRGNGAASVSWTPPAITGGAAISGYVVTASPGGHTCSTSGVASCVVTGLANGSAYTFSVYATNSVGNSTASSVSAPVTPATVPDAPTGVSGIRGDGSVSVNWTAPVNVGGDTITGYVVTASPGGVTVSCASAPCAFTGLVNGTAYSFTVHATNSVGNSVESSASNTVTPATVPDPPTDLSVMRGNGSARVSWMAPVNAGGDAVVSYAVTASPGGASVSCVASPCVVSGLTNGSAYTFSVYATNSLGNSTASSVSGSVTPASVPDAPSAVLATRGDGSVSVSWTDPENAGGDPIVGYTVTASPGGIAVACASNPCVVSGLANGTAYTFTVHATNSVGNSAESSSSTAVVPATIPDPPTGVSLTQGAAPLTLSWTAPTNTGGSRITGYVVIPRINGVAQSSISSNGTATSMALGDLIDGTTYTFTVEAVTAVGTSTPSAASNAGSPVAMPAPDDVTVPTGGSIAATPNGAGYWSLGPSGALTSHGNATDYGSASGTDASNPVVAIGSSSTGNGYWEATADGNVYAFGDAKSFGSMDAASLRQPIVAIAGTPDNGGYWLVGADGGVFAFGDAPFYGSLGAMHLNGPIVGIAVTPGGRGYWLVAADGGVFTFGDAKFYGSQGGHHLNGPMVGIASTAGGGGYLLVAADGGVFTFGNARFHGSLGAKGTIPIVGIIADSDRRYRLIARDGGARPFAVKS